MGGLGRTLLGIATGLAMLASCGDDAAESTSAGGGGARVCTPGEQVACACPGGLSGVQSCNQEGTLLLACQCGSPAGSTSVSSSSVGVGGAGEGGGTASSGGAGGEGAQGGGGSGGTAGGSSSGGGEPVGGTWLRGFGDDAYEQSLRALAFREDGSVLAAIHGRGTFSIGDEIFSSPNDADVAVLRIDPAGNIEGFTRLSGASYHPEVSVVMPLPGGGFALAGHFCEPTDLGDGTLINDGCDGYLARFDEAGQLVEKSIVGGADDQVVLLAQAVGSDVVAVARTSSGNLDWGAGPVESEARVVLARLGEGGEVVWARGFDLHDEANLPFATITTLVAAEGSVVIGGDMANGGADLGDGFLIGPAEQNALFIARFDGDGEPTGSRAIACGGTSALFAMDLDDEGRVAATGAWSGACEEMEGLHANGVFSRFSAIFDATNATTLALPEPSNTTTLTAFLKGDGLQLVGGGSGIIDFGEGPTRPLGDRDLVIAEYDGEGSLIAAERFGPAGVDPYRVQRGVGGALLLGGTTCIDIDLSFDAYTHLGACDAWVLRLEDP
jgi:hypothetical protein